MFSTATLPVIHKIQCDTNEEHDLLNVSRSTGTQLNSSDGGGGVDNGKLSSNDSDNTKESCARIPTRSLSYNLRKKNDVFYVID